MFGTPTFSGGFSGSFILRDEGRCVQRAAAAWGRCYGQLGSRHSRPCWVIVFTAPQVDEFQVAATIGRWATFSGTDKKKLVTLFFLQFIISWAWPGPGPLLDLHAWSVCLVSVTAMVRFAPSCDAFWNAIFATSNPDTMMILMLQCWCLLSCLQVLMKTIVQVFNNPTSNVCWRCEWQHLWWHCALQFYNYPQWNPGRLMQ